MGYADRSEDEILAGELAALGAASGGSGRLVRVVAGLLGKDVHEVELLVPLPFDAAVQHVSRVLGRAGRACAAPPAGSGGYAETIRVVARGGALGMNPVVVTARVSKGGEHSSEVRLRAAAKEGLIRQRAGEKTAARLAALLGGETGRTGGGADR
ncbi:MULTISPECIES: hypothetical protein [unclassified Streptomyces]|uniref:hypothetical protein n=1 Tax=unclassified Streptomyces TaxID=2593676 RepID=UPI0008DCFA22|nr:MULTISPECIES: hypothetical protein [unclassified Streptomyces]OII69391.1 hypothetical protein BJP39_04175 [Streptomyces sp. CC77]